MTPVTATSTDLDAQREADRLELLHRIDQHPDHAIPCRAVDLYVSAAWTSEEDDEQRVAAAACRSRPCPVIEVCKSYGIAYPREVGAYGGLTETERRRTARNIERRTA